MGCIRKGHFVTDCERTATPRPLTMTRAFCIVNGKRNIKLNYMSLKLYIEVFVLIFLNSSKIVLAAVYTLS